MSINDIRNLIPKGYFLGLSDPHIKLICEVLPKLSITNNTCIIDIGSGKGYIDRIISGYLRIPVFCVDSIKERLKSSIRIQRLLNSDKFNKENELMYNYECKLETIEQFEKIMIESNKFFNNVITNEFIIYRQIWILGLKLCGDMFYNLVNLINSYIIINNDNNIKINVLIVPCCLHLCQRWKQCNDNFNPIKDMIEYATNLQCVQNCIWSNDNNNIIILNMTNI
jgi:hypothetical protein